MARIASLALLLALLPFSNITTYSQPDTPFIYYYSSEEQAFIFERADGTERGVLTTYTLPETHTRVEGAGWSPSGEFFTWMSRPAEGGGSFAGDVFILRYSNMTVQMLSTSNRQGIDYLEWSPTNDLLLILSYDITDVITPIVAVYDPTKGEYLFSYTSPDIPQYPPQQIFGPQAITKWQTIIIGKPYVI